MMQGALNCLYPYVKVYMKKKIRLLCKCIYIKEYEMMGLQGREKSGKNRGIEPKRQRKQAQMKINERQNLREQSN